MLTVTCCLYDSHQHVVHDDRHTSPKVNTQIQGRLINDIFRCVHQPQHVIRKQNSQDRSQHTYDNTQQNRSMYRKGSLFLIFGANMTGNDNSCPGGKPKTEPDNQKDK